MGRRNLEHVRELDAAWNMRQWSDYAALFDDRLVAFRAGRSEPYSRAEHVANAQKLCAAFPDCRIETDPYLELFLGMDGQSTCSVALLTGTSPADAHIFRMPFATISRWHDGRVVQQREFLDFELLARQLGRHPLYQGDHR